MREVLKITFSTEPEQNTISEGFWGGFGYLLGPFGFTLVAKWGSRGASLRGRNYDGKKGREEVGGNWQQWAKSSIESCLWSALAALAALISMI